MLIVRQSEQRAWWVRPFELVAAAFWAGLALSFAWWQSTAPLSLGGWSAVALFAAFACFMLEDGLRRFEVRNHRLQIWSVFRRRYADLEDAFLDVDPASGFKNSIDIVIRSMPNRRARTSLASLFSYRRAIAATQQVSAALGIPLQINPAVLEVAERDTPTTKWSVWALVAILLLGAVLLGVLASRGQFR